MQEADQIKELRLSYFTQGMLESKDDPTLDDLFKLMLKRAKYIALDLLYPYDQSIIELPARIQADWQIRCAEELLNRLGNENIQSYSENGLSISYFKSILSSDLLEELNPSKVGIIK